MPVTLSRLTWRMQVQRTHVNEPFSSGDLLLAMEIASAAASAIAALRDRSLDAAVSAAALVVSACASLHTQTHFMTFKFQM
jgi:hypothetical protein